ncbi:chemotaxis protein CheD [Desulfobotulus sp. H1]|uniref:Probable chemoreceptor glutamine deamidase CheD n=1 Tax=Desulfobotulus pelophilus TaxID=2823377 RepID=A0ABT3N5P1_9BACT|nr:chemotaxis protein CheD [Desulfobotulus pelophilus]MCW7752770.1 chemotaxis protein CheD [Desulfobotulus pelophilus]
MVHNPEMLPGYLLQPGFLFIPDEGTVISTVLGSCVAVALFDRKNQKGGMNHFLYPQAPDPSRATTLYGNVSTAALIHCFIKSHSQKVDLEAMIFGGASPPSIPEAQAIAKNNISTALALLQKAEIPISVNDTGGTKGRKIIFDTLSGESVVYRVERLRSGDWYPYKGMRE